MAFTAAQRNDIRKYLGVPFGYIPQNYRLESMMDLVGTDADAESEVTGWLTRLDEIDTALTGTGSTGSTATYGTLKKVDEVEFYPVKDGGEGSGANAIALVNQGRVLIMRIARALGVDDVLPNGDYFGQRRGGDGILALG